jgi:hypothetical protein
MLNLYLYLYLNLSIYMCIIQYLFIYIYIYVYIYPRKWELSFRTSGTRSQLPVPLSDPDSFPTAQNTKGLLWELC